MIFTVVSAVGYVYAVGSPSEYVLSISSLPIDAFFSIFSIDFLNSAAVTFCFGAGFSSRVVRACELGGFFMIGGLALTGTLALVASGVAFLAATALLASSDCLKVSRLTVGEAYGSFIFAGMLKHGL